ncbi:MAG: polyamine aminopropyltransferase [Pseudomonadota bacterium]
MATTKPRTRWIEETFHSDWRVRLKAHRVLHEVKSKHQHLVVFENEEWGTVLLLDGVFQLTTSDEFHYHEMMAHVPLMALERPRDILIIGGGDGGILREVLKHAGVKSATLVDIDREVIDLSLKYFPGVSDGAFDDPRTTVEIADGVAFVADARKKYDAIIVDSSEPIGPSAVLHSEPFFADCQRALKDHGILVAQNGLPFSSPDHLARTTSYFAGLFKSVTPYLVCQPCYFGGSLAINCGTNGVAPGAIDPTTIARRANRRKIVTQLWTPAVHHAAFALPAYVEKTVSAATGQHKRTR